MSEENKNIKNLDETIENENETKKKKDIVAVVLGAFLIGFGIGSIGKNKYKAKCEAYEHINWTIF